MVATVARVAGAWPLELDERLPKGSYADPAVALVRHAMLADRGRHDEGSMSPWHEDVTWRVLGSTTFRDPWTGRGGILDYRRLLARLSDDTFRQRLIGLEGSQGATVAAYLRTTATRLDRRLAIPTLLIFELGEGRIRAVTETPGDLVAWDRFWSD